MDNLVRHKLERVVAGDQPARTWLYEQFGPALLRRLSLRYRELDAEELLQEAYLYFLRNDAEVIGRLLDRTSGQSLDEAGVERFLWDSACGIATNHRRFKGRRKNLPLTALRLESTDATPESESLAKDALERLNRCLRSKGDRLYFYFKLRFADGLSPTQIAQVTGWSMKKTYKLRQALNEGVRSCCEKLGL